ncbi:MAG: fibronectin type III domain-containing protein [Proteobacteria bacterium]|nr:MAG: fibronectin type III domain-containing protein [Pseudomonadota bacterium]
MTAVLAKSAALLVRLATIALSATLLTACLEIGDQEVSSGGQASAVGAPLAAPEVTFAAAPASVAPNGSTTLSWSSVNSTSCSATGNWSGSKATSGSESITSISSDSTYTLTCTGDGGTTSESITVTVVVPATPTLTLSANPATVAFGANSSLTWSTSNASGCTASGAWSGSKNTSGSASVGPLTADSTFTLTCTGAGGQISRSATIDVGAPPPASPTLSLSANPTSVAYQGSTSVSWTSSNVTSCTAFGAWSGSKSASGNQSFSALTSDRTFTLSCTGAGGSITRSVTVAVAPPPAPTLSLSGNPTSVAYNGTSVLSWSSSNATSCSAAGDWSGTKGASGAETVGPLTSDASYTLTCTGIGGSVNRTVSLTVQAPPAPTITLSASPTTLAAGSNATLTWSTTNATSCSASNAWSGSKATSGSQSVGPINSTSTFTLSCSGPGGSNSSSRTVTVAAAPTVTLSANPTSVQSGGSSTLTWSSSNATSCSASGAWSGGKGTSGNETIGSLTSDSTFTLVCTGTGGSTTRSTTVTIVVNSSRSVEVTWDPPTTRADGSPLTNLDGYKIHYGTASGSYTQTITVDNASITSYTVDNLTNGTYYFAVTAYDTDAMESGYSMEVSTTLN